MRARATRRRPRRAPIPGRARGRQLRAAPTSAASDAAGRPTTWYRSTPPATVITRTRWSSTSRRRDLGPTARQLPPQVDGPPVAGHEADVRRRQVEPAREPPSDQRRPRGAADDVGALDATDHRRQLVGGERVGQEPSPRAEPDPGEVDRRQVAQRREVVVVERAAEPVAVDEDAVGARDAGLGGARARAPAPTPPPAARAGARAGRSPRRGPRRHRWLGGAPVRRTAEVRRPARRGGRRATSSCPSARRDGTTRRRPGWAAPHRGRRPRAARSWRRGGRRPGRRATTPRSAAHRPGDRRGSAVVPLRRCRCRRRRPTTGRADVTGPARGRRALIDHGARQRRPSRRSRSSASSGPHDPAR